MIIISAISIKRHTAAGSRDSWTGKHRLLCLLASKMYAGSVPDKPHPFIYLCAAYGRNKENYPAYMAGTIARGSEDEIYVCGDSFSDLLGSRAAGFRFIGVLYGAEKDKTASLFEKEGVPYVQNVLEIPDLLSGI